MGIAELTSREAVLAAIKECDLLGRAEFRRRYGFGRALQYVLLYEGREYDSKAIAGVAYGLQYPDRGPLSRRDFTGGAVTVVPVLERLGFTIGLPRAPRLEIGRIYSWDELGLLFGFRADYLSAAGGMVPRPAREAVILITHPGGGRSFDYQDRWEGGDLIYTGRGQTGQQRLSGANLDVAENRRALFVFESERARTLRFLGTARCVDWWPDSGPDRTGQLRRIYRFRLEFVGTDAPRDGSRRPSVEHWSASMRRGRPFDRARRPRAPRGALRRARPEELLAQQEKAVAGHHDLLCRLDRALDLAGWQDVEEVPAAVDLRGRPRGTGWSRVLFEAKTLSPQNEMGRVRAGLAQLLEYRFFYGEKTDELCLVTSRPVSDERVRFLRAMGIDVIWPARDGFATRGRTVNPSVRCLLEGDA